MTCNECRARNGHWTSCSQYRHTLNEQIAQDDARKLRKEGYSLEQATEYLSWLAALWAELPDLAQAYRAEARNLPALFHKETGKR